MYVWKKVGSPKTVVMAVDGVVPMAKIRQQRLRRFKSVWLAAKERELGVRTGESWDTNSITPGTEFMEALGRTLGALCASKGPGWSVSDASEEGEGEQKIMKWAREQPASALDGKRIAVYGLDADLIVLCLLHSRLLPTATWSIVREKQEFGGKAAPVEFGKEEFLSLDVGGLSSILFPSADIRDILDYICGMSLLGNDFLPHSLGIHIREAGHDLLRDALSQGQHLVEQDPQGRVSVNREALHAILQRWASLEEESIKTAFKNKYKRKLYPRTPAEQAMMPVQNLPLEWTAEKAMWNRSTGELEENWREAYYSYGSPFTATDGDVRVRCLEWCRGLQWILDYYTGQAPVDTEWMFPWSYPPLWRDLALTVESLETMPIGSSDARIALKPQEQLALVLPVESWLLIRDSGLAGLPTKAPVFWPTTFEFVSLGRRQLWECEPAIPSMTPARLRSL
jgi:5'-3' exonuclease